MTQQLNSQHCPLCQQVNRCNVTNASQCWCMTTKVPKALINQVPKPFQGKSCICSSCIAKFSSSKTQFIDAENNSK